jgi:DivIVA domain-containing protein
MSQSDLTPQDVRDVTFGTTRLRAGYNMDEVDSFLDSVEATIAALTKALIHARDQEHIHRSQIDRLHERLAHASDPPTAPITMGHDPIVREVRERLRRILTEQIALLDEFFVSESSSPDRQQQ